MQITTPRPTCNNCGGPKPDRYHKACPACRAEWRRYSRQDGAVTPKNRFEMPQATCWPPWKPLLHGQTATDLTKHP